MKYEYAIQLQNKRGETYIYTSSLAVARIQLPGLRHIYPDKDVHIVRRPAAKWEALDE